MTFRFAISGLRAAATELDVIGNNIANANTTGFKRSRAEFADIAATFNDIAIGVASGSGVRLDSIAQQFSQGNISSTGSQLDLAINGRGFFVIDENENGSRSYTRAGAFRIDRDGFLSNSQGHRLVGFSVNESADISNEVGPLQINTHHIAPQATTDITLDINLDASESVPSTSTFSADDTDSFNRSTSTTVYDSLGNAHTANFYYVKTANENEWQTYTFVDDTQVSGPETLVFSADGTLSEPADKKITIPSFTASGGSAAMTFTVDYNESSQYGSSFAVNSLKQNGFSAGRFSGIDIDKEGVVLARFTNGQSLVQGQIALAHFSNPQGLQPVGNTSWHESFLSGAAAINVPGASSLGSIQSGSLEESNIDLPRELVRVIIAQRAFQANAEVIRAADTVTQSIINLR